MSAQPMQTPDQAKPKRNLRTILLVVLGILICVCIVIIGGAALFGGAISDSFYLSVACTMKNTDMTSNECTAWVNKVNREHHAEYQACFDQYKSTDGTNPGSVYDCLVGKNLGPDAIP